MFVTSLSLVIGGSKEQFVIFFCFFVFLEQIDKIWFTIIYYRIENVDAKIVVVIMERVHNKGV